MTGNGDATSAELDRPDSHPLALFRLNSDRQAARKRLATLGATRLTTADVFPLSSAQQRLWLAGQALPETPGYHLVRVIDLGGELDVTALTAALGEIAVRHEALRTSMTVVAGQPVQRVASPAAAGLPVIDAASAAASELAAGADRRPLDLAGGPLWRAGVPVVDAAGAAAGELATAMAGQPLNLAGPPVQRVASPAAVGVGLPVVDAAGAAAGELAAGADRWSLDLAGGPLWGAGVPVVDAAGAAAGELATAMAGRPVDLAGQPVWRAGPVQRVAGPAAVGVGLPVVDAAGAAAGELAAGADRWSLDLAGGPLWRAELHRLGSGWHRLVLIFHPIIADAATVAMLLAELAAAYRAFQAGQVPELPPAVPYRAYVAWERSFGTDPDCARQLDYWRSQLAGCEPVIRPAEQSRTVTARPAARVPVRIPAMDAYLLRDLARTNGATLNQLVLAGYAVVLHRCGGQASFVIGMPVSTRRDPRWTHSAGVYVATLPIRVSMAGNPTFTELLRQVRSTVIAALGAADVPLEWATGSAGPLYDVTFDMVEGNGPEFALPELTSRMHRVYAGRAEFDLHLEVTDPGPGGDLEGLLEYDAGLFGPEMARHLADGLATLLRGVAATPDQRVGYLPFWPDAPVPSGVVSCGR